MAAMAKGTLKPMPKLKASIQHAKPFLKAVFLTITPWFERLFPIFTQNGYSSDYNMHPHLTGVLIFVPSNWHFLKLSGFYAGAFTVSKFAFTIRKHEALKND
ncbi:hypothetical protein [Vampirovibrio sp.]|uniref:hypothetical protein n=1 Tax=Vampirovibrio sp. TaxID=2717857 RepID=UPI0035944A3B